MINKLKVIFALIIGFNLAVFLFAENALVIEICKYLELAVSVGLLILVSYEGKKK